MRIRQVKKFEGGACSSKFVGGRLCGSTRVNDVQWRKGTRRRGGVTEGRTLLRATCVEGHRREVPQDGNWMSLAQNSPGTAPRTPARVKLDRARQQGAKPEKRRAPPATSPATLPPRPRRPQGHQR